MAADSDFHARLYAATGNQELWDLVRSRSGHIDRLRRLHRPSPGKAQDIGRHHKLIVTAIGASQLDDAQRHLRKHLSGTLGYLPKFVPVFPSISASDEEQYRRLQALKNSRESKTHPRDVWFMSARNRAHDVFPGHRIDKINAAFAPGTACARMQIRRNVCHPPLT
jgi:hypothetical protein